MDDNDEFAGELPNQVAVRYPYPAVDAALFNLLIDAFKGNPIVRIRREQMTAGSSRYIIAVQQEGTSQKLINVGTYGVMMVSPTLTTVYLSSAIGDVRDTPDKTFLQAFAPPLMQLRAVMEQHERNAQELSEINYGMAVPAGKDEIIAIVRRTPVRDSRPGRPRESYNEWVRQQVQRGRNEGEIFEEYLKKRGIDSADEQARNEVKEAFRKALSRTKRTK